MAYSIPGFYEPVNSLLHLGAAAIFLVLGVRMVNRVRSAPGLAALLGVFAFTSVLMLSISGVYHLLTEDGTGSSVLLRLDHAAIFVLIAGTFTPIHGLLFAGAVRWVGLVLMWAASATGVTLVTIFFDRMPTGLSLGLYIALGWLASMSVLVAWRRRGFVFVKPVFQGGLAYSLGAVMLGMHWPTIIPGVFGAHEIWHIAVIIGLGLHWRFVAGLARDAQSGGLEPVPVLRGPGVG